MERPRQNGRWNTAQLLRSIEESQFGEERRHAEPSNHSRSLVSRLGMSELSCFPSSRSRRELVQQGRPVVSQRRTSTSSSNLMRNETRRAGGASGAASNKPERGRIRMFPRRNNVEQTRETSFEPEEDQVFELALMQEASERLHAYRNPTETSLRSSICKRKSSSRGATSEKKLREETQRAANLRRSSSSALSSRASSSLASSIDGLRPQKTRVSRRAPESSSSSSSRVNTQSVSEYHGLMSSHLDEEHSRRPSSLLRARRSDETSSRGVRSPASASRSRSISGAAGGSSSSPSRYASNRSFSREGSSSNMFARRNISNCFTALGSQGRRSSGVAAPASSGSSGVPHSHELNSSSSSSSQVPVPVPLLASALERMPSSSRAGASSSSSEINWQSSASFGWDYHRPRLMAEGLAKILAALERVESDDDLTHEQLLMLEASVLFGGMGLRDQHQAWRMDVDTMSYEELLELGDKMGTVNTGLDNQTISTKLYKSLYSAKSGKSRHSRTNEEFDIKCSICQEEYEKNEQLGWLDCGHQYHAECIKQWLVLKNICPICKSTALSK